MKRAFDEVPALAAPAVWWHACRRAVASVSGLWIFGYAVVLHSALLFYDYLHPGAFLRGDRAGQRLQTVQELVALWRDGGDLSGFLAQHGIVGDYLFHALAYSIAGQFSVIVFQVVLAIASFVALHRMTLRLTQSARMAAIATLIYMHLPHTLVFPHQLVTEALVAPAVIFSLYLITPRLDALPPPHRLALSAVAVGVAALIRPVMVLWPLAVGAAVLRQRRTVRGAVVATIYMVIAWLPIGIWLVAMYVMTGQVGLGDSRHDLSHNLYGRVNRIAAILPPPERAEVQQRYLNGAGRLGVTDYLHFASEHPAGYLGQLGNDAQVFLIKSGIERIVIDYADAAGSARRQLQNEGAGWRVRLERDGLVATARWLASEHAVIALASAAGAMVIVLLWIAAILGAYQALAKGAIASAGRANGWLLAMIPLYVFLTAQAVDAVQSRHRAPAEFALCILAAVSVSRYLGAGARQHRVTR